MPATPSGPVAIALFPDPTPSRLGRLVAAGLAAYARAHRPWVFRIGETDLRRVATWHPAALVTLLSNPTLADAAWRFARDHGIPVVNTLFPAKHPRLPQVLPDEHAIGRLAARHLMDCGLRALAFVGWRRMTWSRQRCEGFCAEARRAGHDAVCLELDGRRRTVHADRRVQRWLRRLPKPVGLFACHDFLAHSLTEACRRVGLSIPQDLALVGVDNDELWCELCAPTVSSVAVPAERVGYEAGALLDRLLAGHPPPADPVMRLAPGEVAQRTSSDVFAHADPEVAAAIRFIRASVNSGNDINVHDVIQQVPISRRTLESRFATLIGHTPLQEIHRLRTERAREMLLRSDLPVSKIALLLGYRSTNRFADAFHRNTGLTPARFRQQRRSP